MQRSIRLLVAFLTVSTALSSGLKTERIILLTIDGLRWQEVFKGPERRLFDPEKHEALMKKFSQASDAERRSALLPFFWGEFVPKGTLLGNGSLGSLVKLKNPYRFSYPGYAEILLGRVLLEIDSNDKRHSPAPTVLEFIRKHFDLRFEDVAAFASWEVFEFICESQPGTIFVNAGVKEIPPEILTPSMEVSNRLQYEVGVTQDLLREPPCRTENQKIRISGFQFFPQGGVCDTRIACPGTRRDGSGVPPVRPGNVRNSAVQ